MKRETNKKKAEKLAEISAISAQFVSEEGLEIYTSLSAKLFNKKRGGTPDKWSVEQAKKALKNGEIIGPPYIVVGKKRIYDLQDVKEWMKIFPKRGVLPDMNTEWWRD
jgi:hypothetical protein